MSSDRQQDADLEQHRQRPWWQYIIHPHHAENIAKYCPLIAAIAAPVSTLLDIPALSEVWYRLDGEDQVDPTASLALSGVGLGLNIIANALLILRFSGQKEKWWKLGTRLSLIYWVGKTIVALSNLIVFGILTRNAAGYSYAEGFWCAVVSVIDAGVISIALLAHWFLAFGHEQADAYEIRSEGRRFMLSVTFLIAILALQSLVFCKLEDWSYSDAIYFSVQVALTIGYGDYAPTTTAGKVLIFPFAVLTISQLGNQIALVVSYFGARAEARRNKWRRKYEGAMHREANRIRPNASLTEEMALIYSINQREQMMSQVYDLLWSAFALVTFWVIGAGIFSSIEGWSYGNGLYSVMIMSLTIGFGDYPMTQPASKIVFIVYALMAVPIVTSFAVQTITGLLSTFSERGATRKAFAREQTERPESFDSHANFVLKYHESYFDMRKRLLGQPFGDPDGIEAELETQEVDLRKDGKDGSLPENGEGKRHEKVQTPAAFKSAQGENPGSKEDNTDPEEERREMRADEIIAQDDAQGTDTPEGPVFNEEESILQKDFERVNQIIARRRSRKKRKHLSPVVETIAPRSRPEVEDIGVLDSDTVKKDTDVDQNEDDMDDMDERDAEHQIELDLLKQLMNRMIQLEAEARQMLLDSMGKGIARTLLLADRNVQVRDVRALRGDDANMLAIWKGEADKTENDSKNRPGARGGEVDMLSRVRRYRNTFAEILVLGSILQKLEGTELNRFERYRHPSTSTTFPRSNTNANAGSMRMYDTVTSVDDKEKGKPIDEVADQTFGGISMRLFKRELRKIHIGDLG